MKFLVDQNRSPALAERLRDAGHDAVHTMELGLERAEDDELLLLARKVEGDLTAGAVVVITDDRIRVRRLPLLHDQ